MKIIKTNKNLSDLNKAYLNELYKESPKDETITEAYITLEENENLLFFKDIDTTFKSGKKKLSPIKKKVTYKRGKLPKGKILDIFKSKLNKNIGIAIPLYHSGFNVTLGHINPSVVDDTLQLIQTNSLMDLVRSAGVLLSNKESVILKPIINLIITHIVSTNLETPPNNLLSIIDSRDYRILLLALTNMLYLKGYNVTVVCNNTIPALEYLLTDEFIKSIWERLQPTKKILPSVIEDTIKSSIITLDTPTINNSNSVLILKTNIDTDHLIINNKNYPIVPSSIKKGFAYGIQIKSEVVNLIPLGKNKHQYTSPEINSYLIKVLEDFKANIGSIKTTLPCNREEDNVIQPNELLYLSDKLTEDQELQLNQSTKVTESVRLKYIQEINQESRIVLSDSIIIILKSPSLLNLLLTGEKWLVVIKNKVRDLIKSSRVEPEDLDITKDRIITQLYDSMYLFQFSHLISRIEIDESFTESTEDIMSVLKEINSDPDLRNKLLEEIKKFVNQNLYDIILKGQHCPKCNKNNPDVSLDLLENFIRLYTSNKV